MDKEVRIIVAGGRDFNNYELMKNCIDDVLFNLECNNIETGIGNTDRIKERDKIIFISGTAEGADKLGEQFANEYKYKCKRFEPDWINDGEEAWKGVNELMAKYICEDNSYPVLIAFWNKKSIGTKHMIDTAIKYKINKYIYYYNQ